MPVRIGISTWNNGAYKPIETWLRAFKQDIDFIELGAAADPVAALSHCSGLILPGGCDPNPALYGKEDPAGLCNVDDARDTLELTLIYHALKTGIPILGICRGFQLANVALGGSLILDLPSIGIHGHQFLSPLGYASNQRSGSERDNKGGPRGNSSSPDDVASSSGFDGEGLPSDSLSPLSRESSNGDKGGPRGNSSDVYHPITITPGSLLHRITGALETTVNSNHHQGIDRVAPCLTPTAFAPDGVIEALELNPAYFASNNAITVTSPLNNPNAFPPLTLHPSPLLLLHFHPERMESIIPLSNILPMLGEFVYK